MVDKEGGAANGGGDRRLRRWHGYAAARIVALVVWSAGASSPNMHSDENLLPSPFFKFSLILTLVVLLLPALLAAVAEGVVFNRSGRASEAWIGLLAGFGFLAGALAIAAVRLLGDFDVSDGFAFHRLTWLGSLVGTELGLAVELVVGSLIYLASPRNAGGQCPSNNGART